MVWGFMDLACIVMTISLLVIETIPAFHDHFKKPFAKDEITGQIQPYKMATYMLDVVINLFFTVDLIIKLVRVYLFNVLFALSHTCIHNLLL